METENNPSNDGDQIPLFPLPATVFYPNTHLPLHIFEPRYRQMVADALEGGQKIGMVLLQPGWEANYFAAPPIASVGCVGEIEQHIRLEDGKYNMVLVGLHRIQIIQEFDGKPYRRAKVELLKEINDQTLSADSHPLKDKLIEHCHQFLRLLPSGEKLQREMDLNRCQTLSHLVDQIAYRLNLTVEQKQKLLEERDVLRRTDEIHAALKMKIDLMNLSRMQKRPDTDWNLN
ncbi:MAG: ATP-dependent protease [Nitrospinaceae bacterium]|nr:MAG: ATP-dependent protease [Nitrospinaceae bacterium]